jgi:hypothetical protein
MRKGTTLFYALKVAIDRILAIKNIVLWDMTPCGF